MPVAILHPQRMSNQSLHILGLQRLHYMFLQLLLHFLCPAGHVGDVKQNLALATHVLLHINIGSIIIDNLIGLIKE